MTMCRHSISANWCGQGPSSMAAHSHAELRRAQITSAEENQACCAAALTVHWARDGLSPLPFQEHLQLFASSQVFTPRCQLRQPDCT